MPTSARIAIATLYLRYRDARRQAQQARARLGRDSVVTDMRQDQSLAVWNDLVSVKTNVYAEIDGHRTPTDPKTFLSLVARRGAALAKAA